MATIQKTYLPQSRIVSTQFPAGTPPTVSTSYVDSQYFYQVKPDINNKNPPDADGWRKPSGWSMDCREGQMLLSGGYRTVSNSGVVKDVYGMLTEWSCPIAPLTSPSGRHIAQVELAVLEKIKGAEVNLGVSWGERKEAAGLMMDVCQEIASAAKMLRKREFAKLGKKLKQQIGDWRSYPNAWLQFQYGWKPLIGDVYTACDAISNNDRDRPTRQWVHASAKIPDFVTTVATYPQQFAPTRSVVKTKHDVKVRVDFGPNPSLGSLATLDAWGLLNPAEVAWELLPFSFMVDWFVPVGKYLACLSAAIPYDFRGGSRTDFSRSVAENTVVFPGSHPGYKYVSGFGRGSSEARRFRRTAYTSFPGPSLKALGPNINNATAETILTRTANAVSILATGVWPKIAK